MYVFKNKVLTLRNLCNFLKHNVTSASDATERRRGSADNGTKDDDKVTCTSHTSGRIRILSQTSEWWCGKTCLLRVQGSWISPGMQAHVIVRPLRRFWFRRIKWVTGFITELSRTSILWCTKWVVLWTDVCFRTVHSWYGRALVSTYSSPTPW